MSATAAPLVCQSVGTYERLRNQWRLPLLTLLGLAANALFIALDVESATAHSIQGNAVNWSINPVDGDETWTGHAHTGWKQVNSARDSITWTGTPTGNPCAGDPNKVHCAYVIKHSNPWRIIKEGHPQYDKTWFSHCAVLGGSEGSNTDRLRGPINVDNMRFYRGGAATCTDGTDAQGGSLHAPDAPGSSDRPDGHDRLHGDQDFLDQHPEVNDYPADWPVAALRGQRLPANLQVIADAHANGRCCDEIKAQDTHTNSGNTVTGADHKIVMFWVWWERAADTEPLCDDGTQPPCPELASAEERFVPVVSVEVPAGFAQEAFTRTQSRHSVRATLAVVTGRGAPPGSLRNRCPILDTHTGPS